jgi:hypothetical protein
MANAILRKEVIRHLAQGHGLSVLAITTPPNKALLRHEVVSIAATS